ncbi:hypothetical protein ACWIGM_05230 [Bosea sp. NPDC055332]
MAKRPEALTTFAAGAKNAGKKPKNIGPEATPRPSPSQPTQKEE